MDSAAYDYFTQAENDILLPHFNLPSINLLPAEVLIELSKNLKSQEAENSESSFTKVPRFQSFPYAVQQNSVLFCGSRFKDRATMLVNAKLRWETKLKKLTQPNIDALIRRIQKLKENDIENLSGNLKKYFKHFVRDPEPEFSGNYNWLYTGGSLCQDAKSDEVYLISGDFAAGKPGFNFLVLNENKDEIQQQSFCQLKSSSSLLQITCKSHTDNLILCARQKNFLNLYKIDRENGSYCPVKLWRKKVLLPKLLTCTDLEPGCEKVIITDTNYDINIFQIETKEKIYGYPGRKIAGEFEEDAWSQIAFGNICVYWALRNRFVMFDLRDCDLDAKFNFELSSVLDPCEYISSFTKSQIDANFVYLGTTHSVLQMDLRNRKPVQKWTHCFESPPQFMVTVKDNEGSEVLLLQSPSVEEISGVTNELCGDGDNVNFISKSLPCILKSIKVSAHSAYIRGTVLRPAVAKRLDFHVTGMQCVRNGQGDFNLFTTNSGGDVFLSKIRKKTTESFLADEIEKETKGFEKYDSHWQKIFCKKKTLRSSRFKIVNMSKVLKDLADSKLLKRKRKKEKEKEESTSDCNLEEKYNYKFFHFFYDPLAQKTLETWIPPEVRVEHKDMEAEIRYLEEKWITNAGKSP